MLNVNGLSGALVPTVQWMSTPSCSPPQFQKRHANGIRFLPTCWRACSPAEEPYISSDLIWPIVLNVFADDERVVDIVCDQLRRGERSSLNRAIMTYRDRPLVLPYPPESPHHGRVAAAIEDQLRSFKTPDSGLELFRLAAVDRGPVMKGSLLDELAASSNPTGLPRRWLSTSSMTAKLVIAFTRC